jgi:hypothetical protein
VVNGPVFLNTLSTSFSIRGNRSLNIEAMTTYVFGAGASRHAGYPLASEMAEGLMRSMLNSEDTLGRPYAEDLIDRFGTPSNIEDLISEIQASLDALRGSGVDQDRTEYSRLGTRLGYLGTSLRGWFRRLHTAAADGYAEFAYRVVQRGDVVISFNYDDSFDKQLKRAGKWDVAQGYGFQLGETGQSSDVLLLKLHGSINWLVSVFGGARGGSVFAVPPGTLSLGGYPFITRSDLDFLGYGEFSGRVFEGGGAFPCLILPGRKKEFFYDTSLGKEYGEFWDHLWSQAKQAVSTGDKIVICGYSLPAADERALDLLLESPRKETHIEVVCGSQSERIANDFRAAGFPNVRVSGEGHFEGWVQREVVETHPWQHVKTGST